MADIKWTEDVMQVALTRRTALFDFSVYDVVPNVSWGLIRDGHEVDLLCLSKAGVFHEVEIKVSRADLKADKRKATGGHKSTQIHCVWFAVPDVAELVEDALELAPDFAGVVAVHIDNKWTPRFDAMGDSKQQKQKNYQVVTTPVVRKPKMNPLAVKPTPAEVLKFLRLGCMRSWTRRHELEKAFEP